MLYEFVLCCCLLLCERSGLGVGVGDETVVVVDVVVVVVGAEPGRVRREVSAATDDGRQACAAARLCRLKSSADS